MPSIVVSQTKNQMPEIGIASNRAAGTEVTKGKQPGTSAAQNKQPGPSTAKESPKGSDKQRTTSAAKESPKSANTKSEAKATKEPSKRPGKEAGLEPDGIPAEEPASGCFEPAATIYRKITKKFKVSPEKFGKSIANELMSEALKLKGKVYPGNANYFLDEIIRRVVKYMKNNGFDPLYLGNYPHCHWVLLEGLTSMRRVGNATMTTRSENIALDGNLGFQDLAIRCFVTYKVWWSLNVRGIFHININELLIHGNLKVDLWSSRKGDLSDFNIPDWGNMDLDIIGDNWLTKFIGFLNDVYPEFFRQNVRKRLPVLVKQKLDEVLEKFEFPVTKKLQML